MVRMIHLLRRLWARANAAIRPREDVRYRQLFENVPVGVYESMPDGRILAANPALVRMLGFDSSEQLKREINAQQVYANPEQRQACLQRLESEGRLQNAELELIRRDGKRITVLGNTRAVRDSRGGRLYYQGTLTDITERKTIERELMAARDKALEATRLKSEFLANMSHELRSPLNAVVGMASLLVGSHLDERQAECAETILSSSRFLIDIIGELLDFSRIEAGRLELAREAFSLRRTVEQAVSILGGRAGAGHLELICDIHPDVPETVEGDGPRLQQVLTNLIGNAIKFTERGEIVVSVVPAGPGRIRFEVADSGIGIDEEARGFIFEPFRQADGSPTRRYGGTGLGLAIARQIVTAMGGRLDCESRPEGGTRFYFEAALTRPPGGGRSRPAGRDVLTGRRVAVHEANGRIFRIMRRWLEAWGVEVVESPHTREGVDVCIVSSSAAGSQTCHMSGPCCSLGEGGLCLRLLPVGQALECSDPRTPVVTKPVHEFDLRAALVRLLNPAQEDPAQVLLPLSRRLTAPPRRLRILAAEDNAINQKVILRLIERLGHQPRVVQNGLEALRAVEEDPFIDLVLMDCQMPEMDGFQATREMRRRGSAIPVVALTANAVQGDREACLASGMDDYLPKPVVLDDLAAAVERWCGTEPRAPGSAGQSSQTISGRQPL